MKPYALLVLSTTLVLSTAQAVAQTKEDAAAACTEAANYIAEDDLTAALEEAKWCVESLQQMKQQAMLTIFPDTVGAYVGGDMSNQSAMGMTMLEKDYRSADASVNVSLTTGMAGGGLAALAQLGMGLSGSGAKKLRIQKRTVLDLSDSTQGQYMVQLKSGATLTIASEELNAEQLLPFVKAFPIVELDDALSQ